ncbi:phage integrase N-terminal SAM-like domain-containing protein [Nocardia gamkensis]|uniref:phage integrase N-terminal SAM-like domain-containing protein n=1 Tax=Nocardia gamkensis TaxID=352869 RepID=UPI0033CE5590
MQLDLDDIRELVEDFATELRRKTRSKQTIDGYLTRIRYFAAYLEERELPTTAPDITRAHIGGYIEDLLTRPKLTASGFSCAPRTRRAWPTGLLSHLPPPSRSARSGCRSTP